MPTITFRNAITDARHPVEISEGQTVREAVIDSGFIAAGNEFSVRDKEGSIVDGDLASEHANEVLSVGLAGDTVSGGGGDLGHLVLSVSEILASGVAGNMAYDLLKNAINHYKIRLNRSRFWNPWRFRRDSGARGIQVNSLLSRDEAIEIAVGLVLSVGSWTPVMPIDAYLGNGMWRVRVQAAGQVATVSIPPGDPSSVFINFELED